MIDDSVPWKDDLLRLSGRLARRAHQTRWTDRTSFLIERDVMVGAYAIRKLLEARKLSDEFAATQVPVTRHHLVGTAPHFWDHWEIWKFYDLANGQNVPLSVREFCNQVIHSWAWLPATAEDRVHGLEGIFVSSDRERRRSVYYVALETLVSIFLQAAEDDIVYLHVGLDATGERTVLRASREHSSEIEQEVLAAQKMIAARGPESPADDLRGPNG